MQSDKICERLENVMHFAGFLNTNINPGRQPQMANYGLMDQIAALKWVTENIQQFGGNPQAVTLLGHNRGAAYIHYLMQSPAVVPGTLKHEFLSQITWDALLKIRDTVDYLFNAQGTKYFFKQKKNPGNNLLPDSLSSITPNCINKCQVQQSN